MVASIDEHSKCTNEWEFSTKDSIRAFHLADLQWIIFQCDQLRSVDGLSDPPKVKYQLSTPTHQLP